LAVGAASFRWRHVFVLDYYFSPKTCTPFLAQSTPNAPWVKVKFQGPATVQLAVADAALVVQLVDSMGNPTDDTVPILQTVLSDESIVKAGVGIDQDMLELYRDWGCSGDFRGRFDMGGIGGKNGRTVSLKALTKAVVGVEMEKSKKIAVSDWGKVPLSKTQIAYCARDAWAAAAIMTKLGETDPEAFSTLALIHLLEDEVNMAELDKRASERKVAKTRYHEIVGKGDDKISMKDLPEDLREEAGQLTETMRKLAPPSTIVFDVGHLGITVQ